MLDIYVCKYIYTVLLSTCTGTAYVRKWLLFRVFILWHRWEPLLRHAYPWLPGATAAPSNVGTLSVIAWRREDRSQPSASTVHLGMWWTGLVPNKQLTEFHRKSFPASPQCLHNPTHYFLVQTELSKEPHRSWD